MGEFLPEIQETRITQRNCSYSLSCLCSQCKCVTIKAPWASWNVYLGSGSVESSCPLNSKKRSKL